MFHHPNNRSQSRERRQFVCNQYPTSIPSGDQPKDTLLILKSQNIFKQQQYQKDHMLEELDMPSIKDFTKLQKEVVLPFNARFQPKNDIKITNMQEFLELQYPAPFEGAQRYQEEQVDNEPFKQYLNIVSSKLNKSQEKFRNKNKNIKENVEQVIEVTIQAPIIEKIQDENDDLSMSKLMIGIKIKKDPQAQDDDDFGEDQDLQFFLQSLNKSLSKKFEGTGNIKFTLPQLLGLDSLQKRDAFRSLPLRQQKQVIQQNLLEQNEVFITPLPQINKEEFLKSNLEDMNKRNDLIKTNYFKIINELDLMRKGVRDIKNKTRQPHGLRKKTETSPDIENIINKVKYTNEYTPGFLDKYQKESQLIALKNNYIQDKHKVEEQGLEKAMIVIQSDLNSLQKKVIKPQREDQIQISQDVQKPTDNDSVISTFSNASKSTKKSVDLKIQISQKAKMMNQYLSEDIF